MDKNIMIKPSEAFLEPYKTMTSREIAREIQKTLLKYRAGLISQDQSRQELTILKVMLKAYDDIVVLERIEKLEATILQRRR